MVTKRRPTHLGEVLKKDVIEPLGLTVTDAARRRGVTRKTLSALLNGLSGISAAMAIRVARPTLCWARIRAGLPSASGDLKSKFLSGLSDAFDRQSLCGFTPLSPAGPSIFCCQRSTCRAAASRAPNPKARAIATAMAPRISPKAS